MKGYKGFNPNMVCNDKQYAENSTYAEDKAKVCECGFHFCPNPFEVLRYYSFLDYDTLKPNRFAKVEAVADCDTLDNKKYATTKLKVGREISIKELVEGFKDYIQEKILRKIIKPVKYISDHGIVSQTEENAYLVTLDADSIAASTGTQSIALTAQSRSVAANTGENSVAEATYLYSCSIVTDNDSCAITSSGNSVSVSTGISNAVIAEGTDSIAIGTGLFNVIENTGVNGAAISIGKNSVVSVSRSNSVAIALGKNNKAKGIKGSYLALSEWKNERIIDFKLYRVDGINIKSDTFYTLINGEPVEC